mmetsp:Transcript_30209/g.48742  ORF Transcript_30209/g.48742 Transcript_30209/m.48742 type:complete len:116 (-) Transcript_30209:225-572(-)
MRTAETQHMHFGFWLHIVTVERLDPDFSCLTSQGHARDRSQLLTGLHSYTQGKFKVIDMWWLGTSNASPCHAVSLEQDPSGSQPAADGQACGWTCIKSVRISICVTSFGFHASTK